MLNNKSVLNIVLALGAFVPISYYLTYLVFKKAVPINKLWGSIDTGLRSFYTISMFICVISMLAVLFFMNLSITDDTKVINKKYSEGGILYYIQSLGLIIVPSLVWMPLTYLYLLKPNPLIKYAIIVTLATVGLGGLLLAHTVNKTYPKDMINRNLTYKSIALAGASYLAFHLVVLDASYWSYSFF